MEGLSALSVGEARQPNDAQRAFIDDFAHNQILYAGAGTGKTYALARKIEAALARGFAPEEILCLTFTDKAKKEMREDVESCIRMPMEQIYTIHGYCLRVLRAEAKRTRARDCGTFVKDESDCAELMARILPEIVESVADDALFASTGKHLSDFRRLPPVAIGETVVWQYRDGWIDFFGRPVSKGRVEFLSARSACPICGRRVLGTDCCPGCGADPRNAVPRRFDYDYYGWISAVRHKRVLWGIESDSEERDYAETIRRLAASPEWNELVSHAVGKRTGEAERFAALVKHRGAKIILRYLRALEEANAYDFDDLILRTEKLFREAPPKGRYRLVIVDEMQDTSELEYRVLLPLFDGAQVVLSGDYFQTIYEWRGSVPMRILASFEREFRAVRCFFAENFRSTRILAAAGIGFLRNAFPDHPFLPPAYAVHSAEEGSKIACGGFDSPELEAKWLFDAVRGETGSVCLMTRSNRAVARLYERMQKCNAAVSPELRLPFFTMEETQNFCKHPEIKDLLAWMEVLSGSADLLSYERVAERYVKGVGSGTLQRIRREQTCSIATFFSEFAQSEGDAYAPWLNRDGCFVVYDLETTGLDCKRDEAIQLAAIKFDYAGRELGRMNELLIPGVPISDGAYRTHGKTLAELLAKGSADLCGVLTRFSAFVRGCYLFGHNNLSFDRTILRRQYRENGIPLPEIVGEGDTLRAAKQCLPFSENYKLSTLCSFFSVVNRQAHDAFSDVCATKEIFLCLRDRIIVPQTAARREATARYLGRFEKLLSFCRRLREALREDRRTEFADLLFPLIASRRAFLANESAQRRISEVREMLLRETTDTETALRAIGEDLRNAPSDRFSAENKIPIVTVHQTKGCEYDSVYLFRADALNFPNAPSVRSGREEEERRIFYVAMTRARKKLTITYAREELPYGGRTEPSPYPELIPAEDRTELV